MRRTKELDGLRAIAILLVLGCHYEGFAMCLGGLPEFGWLGVDIFFVLSGYLITTILIGLRDQPKAYRIFYSRRAIRVVPPYIIATLAAIIVALPLKQYVVLSREFLLAQIFFIQAFSGQQWNFIGDLVLHPIVYFQNSPPLLSYAGHLPAGDAAPGVSATAASLSYWSLSVEEYFYLVWAPVVLKCSRKKMVIVAVVVCFLEGILRWLYTDWNSYFGIIFRLDTLLYGALLAALIDYVKMPSRGYLIFGAALAGIAAIIYAVGPVIGNEIRQSPLFRVFGLPLVSIAMAALIGIIVNRRESGWWFCKVLRAPLMQYIGTISYTMYLVHLVIGFTVFVFVNRFQRQFGMDGISDALKFAQALLDTMLTIIVARLSWHYLEKPLLRWKDRRFPGVNVTEPALN